MDDLIVIILTLVFAAVGIFGQMKKKQAERRAAGQPEPQPEAESETVDNFWDFLEPESQNNQYMEQAPVAQPKKQGQPVQAVTKEPAVKKTEYQFKTKNEETSIYKNDLTSNNNEERKNKMNSKNRFSLKKAVIYSEILNRKYT